MRQIIPSGFSGVYALNSGAERAMQKIIPSTISIVFALNSDRERGFSI